MVAIAVAALLAIAAGPIEIFGFVANFVVVTAFVFVSAKCLYYLTIVFLAFAVVTALAVFSAPAMLVLVQRLPGAELDAVQGRYLPYGILLAYYRSNSTVVQLQPW